MKYALELEVGSFGEVAHLVEEHRTVARHAAASTRKARQKLLQTFNADPAAFARFINAASYLTYATRNLTSIDLDQQKQS